MFEFGKKYTLEFCAFEAGKPVIFTEEDMEVVSADTVLVKFSRDSHEVVVNTSSPAFVRGTLQR